MILVANPKAQYLHYKTEIDAALSRVLEKGRYILGDETRLFEEEFAAFLGVRFAIGVGSGTEAIHIALKACGIGPGDEVITVSHTAVATIAAIELAGASPVLVDIDPSSLTMDPAKLEGALSPKTKAVVPVHLYGQPANLPLIEAFTRKHKLRLIEDAAQAHGAFYQDRRVGSWGDLGCFSFYPTKNLGALGDGGAVATNDAELAKRARLLREYGWAERYVSHLSGWNSRLDEMQSAVLRVKLRYLDRDNAERARIAKHYQQALQKTSLQLPAAPAASVPVHHLYVIRSAARGALMEFLQSHSIQTLIHYPVPVHLQPAYKGRLRKAGDLPVTEKVAGEVLSIPIYPELEDKSLQATAQATLDFHEKSIVR